MCSHAIPARDSDVRNSTPKFWRSAATRSGSGATSSAAASRSRRRCGHRCRGRSAGLVRRRLGCVRHRRGGDRQRRLWLCASRCDGRAADAGALGEAGDRSFPSTRGRPHRRGGEPGRRDGGSGDPQRRRDRAGHDGARVARKMAASGARRRALRAGTHSTRRRIPGAGRRDVRFFAWRFVERAITGSA